MKETLLCVIYLSLVGCYSDSQLELVAELSMPYMDECNNTVNRARAYHDTTFESEIGYIDFDVDLFDKTFIEDFGVDGLLKISVYGDLQLLDGITPEYYVRGISDSIAIECVPDVSVSFEDGRINNEFNKLRNSFRGPILPVIKQGRVYLYFNKKDQRIEHW